MRKKMIGMVCVLACGIGLCSGCGSADSSAGSTAASTIGETKDEAGGDVSESEDSEDDFGVFDYSATIEETVLYNENDVVITAKSLETSNNTATLTVLLENNSDKTLSVNSCTLGYSCNAVNGYMVDNGYIGVDLEAGGQAEETMDFYMEELQCYGITKIADLELGFTISDEDYNYIYTGPCKLETSLADQYDYETDTYQKAIKSSVFETLLGCSVDGFQEDHSYSECDVSVLSNALITSQDEEKVLLLEFENTSDDLKYIVLSDVRVNDSVAYEYEWSIASVNGHTKRVSAIDIQSLLDEMDEAPSMEEVTSLTFAVSLMDANANELTVPQDYTVEISATK